MQTRAAWTCSLWLAPEGEQPDAGSRRREGLLFSSLKGGLRKVGSEIFFQEARREWENMNICALGSVLDSAQATVWSWRQLETSLHPAGGWVGLLLACWLRNAATSLHPLEPRRAAGKGGHTELSALRHQGACMYCVYKRAGGRSWSLAGTLHRERHPRSFPPPSAFGDRHLWPILMFLSTLYSQSQLFIKAARQSRNYLVNWFSPDLCFFFT